MPGQTPSPHPELDALAIELFRLISRFEYALKAAGYVVREDGKAEPNWDRFARDIDEAIVALDDAKWESAATYLLANPPKRQMVRNGELVWEDGEPDPQPQTRLLLTHIRQVRNNLFHGGKFNGRWFDPQRSGELIEASLVILRQAVDLDPAVREAFNVP